MILSVAVLARTAAGSEPTARSTDPRSARGLVCSVLALTWLLAAAPAAHAIDKPARPASLPFLDRFERLDPKHWYISDGWSNGPHQDCVWLRRNVRIIDGRLRLKLDDSKPQRGPHTRNYGCAEVQTRRFFHYGVFEVRMRAAAGPGLVSAFFTFTGPPHGAKRPHDEIDFEVLGKTPRKVQVNFFGAGKGGHEKIVDFGLDSSRETIDYAMEWSETALRWFVNGRLMHERRRAPGAPWPTIPSKVYFSLWNGTGANMEAWLGRFAYPGRPLTMDLAFFGYTPAGGRCLFPESIVCRWERAGRR